MDKKRTFKELNLGETFDWIDPNNTGFNSFFLPCLKTGARSYMDTGGVIHKVGSLDAKVFHVGERSISLFRNARAAQLEMERIASDENNRD